MNKYYLQNNLGEVIGSIDKEHDAIIEYVSNNNVSTNYINVNLGDNSIAKYYKNDKWLEMVKKLPELYSKKSECCGCSACANICQTNNKNNKTLFMAKDLDGFLYPIVDASKCVRCYKCLSVCPLK